MNGAPAWWVIFCIAAVLGVGGALAHLFWQDRRRRRALLKSAE